MTGPVMIGEDAWQHPRATGRRRCGRCAGSSASSRSSDRCWRSSCSRSCSPARGRGPSPSPCSRSSRSSIWSRAPSPGFDALPMRPGCCWSAAGSPSRSRISRTRRCRSSRHSATCSRRRFSPSSSTCCWPSPPAGSRGGSRSDSLRSPTRSPSSSRCRPCCWTRPRWRRRWPPCRAPSGSRSWSRRRGCWCDACSTPMLTRGGCCCRSTPTASSRCSPSSRFPWSCPPMRRCCAPGSSCCSCSASRSRS